MHNPVELIGTIDSQGNDAGRVVATDVAAESYNFRDEPAGNVRTLSVTSAQSAAITGTKISVTADAACFISVGTNPTAAVNTSFYLPANETRVIDIETGDLLAGIVASGTGNLYYHPVA